MLPTHTIICSSNPQRPRGGRRCGERRYNTNQSCRIELFDITGRKLKVVLFTAGYNKTSIALADILPGVYTYKFLVGDTLIKSGKIIKQ